MSELNAGLMRKIKEAIWNIDPNRILHDVHGHGVAASSLVDLAHRSDIYPRLQPLMNQYVKTASRYSALTGASSGFGGFVSAVTFASADLVNIAAQLYRLNQKLALVHGQDITHAALQHRLQQIYLQSLGFNDKAQEVILGKVKIDQNVLGHEAVKSFAVQLVKEVAKHLAVKLSRKQAAKVIPLLGAAVGGGANYWFTQRSGQAMIQAYQQFYCAERAGISEPM
ncbi:EcsC family protein [Celerinatantimonas diazotrophica]|uniref:EcsC family protein n=1 Tax=Celerinatantimonas diazotrophica TaxID=412034 RepID=A0A4R1J8C0_9GAMM|nr:EcsC family protein [Celerinatantimonas diazotrophica]TCK46710.1 EcsC family protein [Celerinatantimonas diazotrophica]CAG9295412.1 hypothetical protein CEDIAZO_00528 [Celerinatantimonas diazotrophica]